MPELQIPVRLVDTCPLEYFAGSMLQKAEKEKLLSSISPMMARRTIAILYGTETGNSEEIADELAKMVQRLHFDAVVEEMNAFTLVSLL